MSGKAECYGHKIVALVLDREQRISGRDRRIRNLLYTFTFHEGHPLRPWESVSDQMAGLDDDGHRTAIRLFTLVSESLRCGGGTTSLDYAVMQIDSADEPPCGEGGAG
jgi:hypothetical protein